MSTCRKPHCWSQHLIASAILLFALIVLFSRSFSADQALFANDAPLGVLQAQEKQGISNFKGFWLDLNWIGAVQPTASPNVSSTLYVLSTPVIFAKFYAPIALLILGLSAYCFFRRLRFSPAVCLVGGLAAMLSTGPFSYACWGLASITLCMAACFAALAMLASIGKTSWIRFALAGLFVGLMIMEGYDTGAILSLYVAAFVLVQARDNGETLGRALMRGSVRVVVVALFAVFISTHALSTLIGTQLKGVAGTQQDTQTKEQRWDAATMWSLPKIETLRVVIPGLFGYRLDTPGGGNYWGTVGQTPGVPQSRHSGSGVHAGVLVALIAAWAIARSSQKKDSPFSEPERKFLWFWAGAALISLLLAYGRHAPFYQFFYKLPYFSTIRNPIKFMHPFTIAWVILFAYGLEGLSRRYLQRSLLKSSSWTAQMKAWWSTAQGFDKKWVIGSLALFGVSILGWLVYSSSRSEAVLERHIQQAGFPAELAPMMARFSIIEVGWFVLFLGVAIGALILILSGAFSGPRAKWAGILLGLLLVTDLARANSPWIIYYNYIEKYATNPVIDLLREKPHEHRVGARLGPMTPNYLATDQARSLLGGLAEEWLQHHFQFYRIQSLDIVQMPRMPQRDTNFMTTVLSGSSNRLSALGRLWQLTNTRYILGMNAFLEAMNQQIDPTNQSFRVRASFDFVPRDPAGTVNSAGDITAVIRPEAPFAVFEFGAALPRAKLFAEWQVVTNDDQGTLQRLADPAFDPRKTVLVSTALPTAAPAPLSANQSTGSVEITHYEPKRITLKAEAKSPSVLLLSDKYDSNWEVTVDASPAPLLRCNYIMRGVFLQPGSHLVEFRFNPPHGTLYVSLAAIAVGLILCGILVARPRRTDEDPAAEAAPESGDQKPQIANRKSKIS